MSHLQNLSWANQSPPHWTFPSLGISIHLLHICSENVISYTHMLQTYMIKLKKQKRPIELTDFLVSTVCILLKNWKSEKLFFALCHRMGISLCPNQLQEIR